LNLYVYVANNPLKYRDPTGHVKFTFKLENAGKKAVELNGLGFVFAGDDGSATIGVIMLITEGLGVVVEF
jgi:hypothetical protein